MQIRPHPLRSLLVAYTKSPSSLCTRDLAWKCFSRWVLQLPVPELLSIIHQCSCCFTLPCFTCCCSLGLQHHLPPAALTLQPRKDHVHGQAHSALLPALTHTLAVLSDWERWWWKCCLRLSSSIPPSGCHFWAGLEAPSLCCPSILKSRHGCG